MSKPRNGAVSKATPRRKGDKSGGHEAPRRKLSASKEAWELWDRAREHALDDSWAEWARHVLTIAAADELGLDPADVLIELGDL